LHSAKDKVYRSIPRNLDLLEPQKLYIILLLFLLTCNGQVLTLCPANCRSMCTLLGPKSKSGWL
jgi:hypothetical protein